MKFEYHSDTDMLYIRLAEGLSVESEEIAPGIVMDFDQEGRPIKSKTPASASIPHSCFTCTSRLLRYIKASEPAYSWQRCRLMIASRDRHSV